MTEDDILNIKNDLNYIIGIINHNLKLIELKVGNLELLRIPMYEEVKND